VHQGGLLSDVPEVGARKLEPTESVATYTTDYAPPAEDAAYAGPTNRVRTDVPAPLVPHPFISVSTSHGVRRVSQVLPSAVEGDAQHISAQYDSLPAQSLAVSEQAQLGAERRAGAKVTASDGLRVDGDLGGYECDGDSASLQLAAGGEALANRLSRGAPFALGDNDVLSQPSTASRPLRGQTSEVPNRYETARAGGVVVGPDRLSGSSEAVVVSSRAGSNAARNVAGVGQPLGVYTDETASDRRLSHTVAAGDDRLVIQDVADGRAGTLLAERAVLADGRRSEAGISPVASDRAVIYEQRSGYEVERDSANVTATADAEAATGSTQGGNILALEDSVAARFRRDPSGVISALESEALRGRFTIKALREEGDRVVVRETANVSPPWLAVLLEGKLIGERGVRRLVDGGVLETAPPSRFLIRYRLFIFNGSESAATDVKVINRLDTQVSFFAAPAGQVVEIESQPETGTVVVSAPKLESMEAVTADFYVELTR
jgi:hypothetical protein